MKAQLNNYRQSPRKVRLVAGLIKGKTVPVALAHLQLLPKRAAAPLAKLVRSALANAGTGATDLVAQAGWLVQDIRVEAGATIKRFRPRARGSAARINKRTSQVRVELVAVKK